MMADWRKIYSKICENEELGECSLGANLLFERLLIKTDDEGRYYANPSLINKLVFTARKDIKDRQIIAWLGELEEKGLILLYQVNNKKFLFFHNFHKYQQLRKDIKPKIFFPEPSVTDTERPVTNAKQSVDIRGEERRGEEREIASFWDYFLLKTKKKFRLTPTNRDLIKKRLADKFTIGQMKQAVDSFIQDDWKDRQKHLDLKYCIGIINKVDKLEHWLNCDPKPKVVKPY